jgi:hypothetical protein
MACAPTDQATLDYERVEEALFRAVSGQDVAFDSCDLGTFEELKKRVSEYRPHILHLTGHGVVLYVRLPAINRDSSLAGDDSWARLALCRCDLDQPGI